ncbi:MAG: undecaprenyldiphospho-muramoylpentapeptide beta-N-acetylglucosaminyltransferase [Gammaproteobacteria bacterium]|nr:undecaprenyldiphospho-muramoylpentapeptide beta-N-acetylglucosaminyltransferase [Gammaproteobacteria bacterium]
MKHCDAPVLIMAGGTGGHVFPALAVAHELMGLGVPVIWMGTHQGMEAGIVTQANIPMHWINVSGLRGKGIFKMLIAPFILFKALIEAARILHKTRPRVVLGMGGFVSGPGGLMAWLMRYPLVIHEQNRIAGLTNRWLRPLATRALEAFPGSLRASRKTLCLGNPVRADISAIAPPQQRLVQRSGLLRVLVLGGSLGAQVLNELMPKVFKQCACEVRHQAGRRGLVEAQQAYHKQGLEVQLDAFIDDMAAAYAWADVVVCRAGALTIAELAAVGVASILVPYPYAVDDHQSANAHYLSDEGAAILLSQTDFQVDTVVELLTDFIADRTALVNMACVARSLAQLQATQNIAAVCLQNSSLGGEVLNG